MLPFSMVMQLKGELEDSSKKMSLAENPCFVCIYDAPVSVFVYLLSPCYDKSSTVCELPKTSKLFASLSLG